MTTNPEPTTRTAANGEHTTDGVPHGFTSLTPFVVVRDAADAIEFYERVFGATVIDRTDFPGPDGGTVVAHATLDFGTGRLQLGDPLPDYGLVAPPTEDRVSSSLSLYCRDVDATLELAVDNGATIREPITDFVSGDRFASIRDPFGVRWAIMTRVEDLSEEESRRRVTEWAATQG